MRTRLRAYRAVSLVMLQQAVPITRTGTRSMLERELGTGTRTGTRSWIEEAERWCQKQIGHISKEGFVDDLEELFK